MLKDNNPAVMYVISTHSIGDLEGRVLTLIDASMSDPVQRKAMKDLLRPMIWNWAADSNMESYYELKQKSVGNTPMGIIN